MKTLVLTETNGEVSDEAPTWDVNNVVIFFNRRQRLHSVCLYKYTSQCIKKANITLLVTWCMLESVDAYSYKTYIQKTNCVPKHCEAEHAINIYTLLLSDENRELLLNDMIYLKQNICLRKRLLLNRRHICFCLVDPWQSIVSETMLQSGPAMLKCCFWSDVA